MPLFRRLGSVLVVVALPFLQLVVEPSSLKRLQQTLQWDGLSLAKDDNSKNATTASSSMPHPFLAWHGRYDLLKHNRFFSSLKQKDDNPLLPPLSVMKKYIQQHNSNVLREEWQECQRDHGSNSSAACHNLHARKFLTATYACPMEAGNRIHRFMNGLLWAILTNRTFLTRYHTVEVCQEYDDDDDHTSRCEELFHSQGLHGNQTDCEGILHLHQWVPSYDDEWRDKLQLHNNITRAQLHPKQSPDHATLPFDAIMDAPTTIIRTGLSYQLSPGDILYDGNIKHHLQQPQNIARLQRLTNITTNTPNDKVYFLYGMLQEALFTIDEKSLMMNDGDMDVESNHNNKFPTPPQSTHTFVLHSRHTGTHPDNYIWPEHMCLERINNNATTTKTTNDNNATAPTRPQPLHCHIYVMSDRDTTLQLLHAEIDKTTNCTHSSVNNTSSTTPSFNGEHGPFAGRGFWQDLVLASQARQGMIAFHMHHRPHGLVRTSSALVRERIEFRRTMEWYANEHHQSMPPPPFWQCQNPWKE